MYSRDEMEAHDLVDVHLFPETSLAMIRQLLASEERLRVALKPFADVEMFTENADDDDIVLVTVGSIRKAREALK